MERLFRTKAIRLESGERFPLLVYRQTEVPVMDVIDYSLAYHRTISITAGKARVETIGYLLEWTNERQIDLDERIGTGDLLAIAEVEDLAGYLRRSRRKTIEVGGEQVPAAILGKTHANRIDWIIAYLQWRVDRVAQAMSIGDPRLRNFTERIQRIGEQLGNLKGKGGGKVRLGLTEEQQFRLFQIVRPDCPENPFHQETRHRNYLLFLMLWELGLRRAEPLVLKGKHVQSTGTRPYIIIEPHPDDPDEKRKEPPLVKTAGRTLAISRVLAVAIHEYITVYRSKVPGAKKNPYIVLDSTSGDSLSLYSVYDMFVVLRNRFPEVFPPDFSPHILRHTWNDRFKKAAKAANLNGPFAELINNYLMGWSKTSKQSNNYSRRQIEEAASVILVNLQGQLVEALG